jgi:hypothetical protein
MPGSSHHSKDSRRALMPLKVASIPTKTANSSRSSLRLRKCVCPAVVNRSHARCATVHRLVWRMVILRSPAKRPSRNRSEGHKGRRPPPTPNISTSCGQHMAIQIPVDTILSLPKNDGAVTIGSQLNEVGARRWWRARAHCKCNTACESG